MILFRLPSGEIVPMKRDCIITASTRYADEQGWSVIMKREMEIIGGGHDLDSNTKLLSDDVYLAWDLDSREHAEAVLEKIWTEIGIYADRTHILIDMPRLISWARRGAK